MEHTQDADLQARLAALERSLADLTAAGVGEAALAVLEQQAAAIRQQLSGTGLQVGHDQTVQGDVVQRDKIDQQINTGGAPYIAGDVTLIGAQAAERFLQKPATAAFQRRAAPCHGRLFPGPARPASLPQHERYGRCRPRAVAAAVARRVCARSKHAWNCPKVRPGAGG